MSEDAEFLFTYGTLMRGFENPFAERLHSLSTFEGTGTFPGTLYNISWYPGAVYREHAGSQVYGEVFRMGSRKNLLKELDDYEEVSDDETKSLYVRKVISVRMQDTRLLPCWVYLYNQDVSRLQIIGSGNFRDTVH